MTGSGTLTDPYVIYDADDLQNVNNNLTAYYQLANDIDATATPGWNGGEGFIPLGPFLGNLEGKGHKITGLTLNRPTSGDYQALFNVLGGTTLGEGRVYDLSLEDTCVSGAYRIGSFAGYINIAGVAMRCGSINPTVLLKAGGQKVGGFCGAQAGQVYYSFVRGGSVGYDGPYSATPSIGGFQSDSYRITRHCYARVDVSGNVPDANKGGFNGHEQSASGWITTCYSTGHVIGSGYGFSGRTFIVSGVKHIRDCYWDKETSGKLISDYDGGDIVGLTTVQAKLRASYDEWNFSTIWWLRSDINDGYPCLQNVTGGCIKIPAQVSTNAATNVEETSATLNGTLDDDAGEARLCGFEWGPTEDYGTFTPRESKVKGQTFSQNISGLSPGVKYYFRAVV